MVIIKQHDHKDRSSPSSSGQCSRCWGNSSQDKYQKVRQSSQQPLGAMKSTPTTAMTAATRIQPLEARSQKTVENLLPNYKDFLTMHQTKRKISTIAKLPDALNTNKPTNADLVNGHLKKLGV